MAYCVLNYHQKASNGAYLSPHSASMANDPTIALQAEMRLLSTKDSTQNYSHSLTNHTHHQHMHHHHHHHHAHHLPHLSHVPNSHHMHQHLHPAQVAIPKLSHRHASSSSLASNSSSNSSTASNDASIARPLPRNRRRSHQQNHNNHSQHQLNQQQQQAQQQAQQHGHLSNEPQQFQFQYYSSYPNHPSQARRNYSNAQINSNSINRNRAAHDSRRGSTGSSVRGVSPSSSAFSDLSCGSSSVANTRSPSPQLVSSAPLSTCQRVPSPLSTVETNLVDSIDRENDETSTSPVVASTDSSIDSSNSNNTTTSATGQQQSNLSQQVLSYEQVHRLHQVMEQVVPIHGRGNFPTLDIKLKTLVNVVRNRLESAEPPVKVNDIRLNGGAASYVLSPENNGYNDLDLIFTVDLTDSSAYDRVRSAVLDSLLEFLPDGVNRTRLSSTSLKEAYIHKMVKVTDQDKWSLISLSNNRGRNVELKFVDTMKRQFEFSVDSFHIILDSLLLFYNCSQLPISANIYPTVIGESVYGDFAEALDHLQNKLIATRNPEQIRGGGLLKYCNLLIRDYQPADPENMKTLERYMCSRFFIDFNEINQQRSKLESYLANHFIGDDNARISYLIQLYKVVDESTVCLMSYERKQTLCLIEELAYNVYYQLQHSNGASSSMLINSPVSNARPVFAPNFKMPLLPVLTSVDHLRSNTPSVDAQSNEDVNSDQESTESANADLCSAANCNCNGHSNGAIPQYQTFVLSGASGHFYYPAFQPGYSCFNSCQCGGGWMTCA